jgi:hypothetical protein
MNLSGSNNSPMTENHTRGLIQLKRELVQLLNTVPSSDTDVFCLNSKLVSVHMLGDLWTDTDKRFALKQCLDMTKQMVYPPQCFYMNAQGQPDIEVAKAYLLMAAFKQVDRNVLEDIFSKEIKYVGTYIQLYKAATTDDEMEQLYVQRLEQIYEFVSHALDQVN